MRRDIIIIYNTIQLKISNIVDIMRGRKSGLGQQKHFLSSQKPHPHTHKREEKRKKSCKKKKFTSTACRAN
jgi:hypothetical protein